ncbi:MAG: 16S rRNA (uracil(1498)-N(3))-methyltransferase [Lachnospiraceae bacterium]|nr:16S rRNA (uracil(1498)-N(3))-methyltransferase [Lachnospiraceae bacterium]
MYQFFTEPSGVQEGHVVITGSDVNHIKNVLRMRAGEKIAAVCEAENRKYLCEITELREHDIFCRILSTEEKNTELPAKIYLFQGLPKGDKMELILQKAVELGCFEIIPVICRRCVVKLEEKKRKSKVERWQAIAEAAAKQSGRGIIPIVHEVTTFSEALSYANDMDVRLIPYERAADMAETKKCLAGVRAGQKIAVFIGPEGGFEEAEIEEAAKAGVIPVTLGRRILRTETAAITVTAWLMYLLEEEDQYHFST